MGLLFAISGIISKISPVRKQSHDGMLKEIHTIWHMR